MGRHPSYTREFAELVLSELAEGKSLRQICADHKTLPSPKTIREWIKNNVDGFRDKYAGAKEEMLESWAEDILHISDETKLDTVLTESGEHADHEWINRSRLRVDTRKWLLSKLNPKKYGDKITNQVEGSDGGPVQIVVNRGTKKPQ